ncbi:MAG: hemerythrin domain-containing protein [Alphaproteobacteria bacterium]
MRMTLPSLSPHLFLRPLDFIRSEHDRQLEICDRIGSLIGAGRLPPLLAASAMLLVYLTCELPLHCRDEEEDLLPHLRRRGRLRDRIDGILAELDRDHATELFLGHSVATALRAARAGGADDPDSLFDDLGAFAAGQRRHIAWENRTVLPLARERLHPEDLAEMGRNMMLRRGIALPPPLVHRA